MVLFGSSGKNARLVGTALLILTFIAGGLAGAAVVKVVGAEAPSPRREGPMRGGPRRLLLDEQFAKELGLTQQQRTQIKNILDRRDAEAKKLWEGFEPKLHDFSKQVHDEIQQVLTPAQQKQLDRAVEQRRTAFRLRRACTAADSARILEGSKEKSQ